MITYSIKVNIAAQMTCILGLHILAGWLPSVCLFACPSIRMSVCLSNFKKLKIIFVLVQPLIVISCLSFMFESAKKKKN